MSKYFKEIEENMDASFLKKLDKARELYGKPMIINSAFRTPEHNKEVGGKPNSAHLYGLAVDIRVDGSRSRFEITTALIEIGFNRIGVAKSFIHVDDDTTKDKDVLWTY